jgi:hypothetical protein
MVAPFWIGIGVIVGVFAGILLTVALISWYIFIKNLYGANTRSSRKEK